MKASAPDHANARGAAAAIPERLSFRSLHLPARAETAAVSECSLRCLCGSRFRARRSQRREVPMVRRRIGYVTCGSNERMKNPRFVLAGS